MLFSNLSHCVTLFVTKPLIIMKIKTNKKFGLRISTSVPLAAPQGRCERTDGIDNPVVVFFGRHGLLSFNMF